MSSRLADYLNKYLDGVAASNPEVLRRYACDGSVLEITPEVVVQPVNTADVRKTVLLASQLADKGLLVGVTARGNGSDKTGAAIGSGIVVETRKYMNRVLNFDPRQRLIHVQAGVSLAEINKILTPHGLFLPLTLTGLDNYELNDQNHTIGGLIANNLGGQAPARLGRLMDYLVQMEVVLADGSIYHTENLNARKRKKEVDPESFGSKINTSVSEFVERNAEVLGDLKTRRTGNTGFVGGLSHVKNEKSLNLMPLFLGSQGSLGIITEVILSTDYIGPKPELLVAKFNNAKEAVAFASEALAAEPSTCNLFDGRLFADAKKSGKSFLPLGGLEESAFVMLVGFDDSSTRHRQNKIRDLEKILEQNGFGYISTLSQEFNEDYFYNILKVAVNSYGKNYVMAPILDGVIVPMDTTEKYLNGMARLERLLDNNFYAYGSLLTNLWTVRPKVNFIHEDKQPILRLIREYGRLVLEVGGILAGEGGEGRVKAVSSLARHNSFADEVNKFVKRQFDPRGIMNTGVKQTVGVDQLAQQIRDDNDFGILGL